MSASPNPLLALPFEPSIEALGEAYWDVVEAAAFPQSRLRFRNDPLLQQLGVDPAAVSDADLEAAYGRFEGRTPLLALRYHGYQFGTYNPFLGDGRGFLRGEQGPGIGGGRPGIRLGEPRETGGVDVAAVVALVAGAFCRPLAPREKERERKFVLFVGDDRLDVVVGVGDDFLDLAGGRERFAELAGAGFKRVEPRAQRGERVRSLDAADDGRTGFGAHSEEGRGRR
jgi:hypothetical protein